ncbi:hypothetical protein C2R22_18460 [Salinigranum rubrum]|uniref:Uncharacterized protein n=1 Tax=Salinigranum rubrum TaxID=755307 RepID=A0A2I8VQ63_9EURY|nr:hypothetical protein [Salinigranum rubrum]AUV84058.1 hypothetical protein C2R22_18460 [Salinigranum rubrum]
MTVRNGAVAVGLLVLLAGCLGGLVGGDTVVEREYPDRPPELTEETVGPYVAEYEEVYRYNAIVEEETERIQEIVVGAGVVSVTPRDDGYEVVVSVGFYWTFGDDGSGQPAGIADGRPYEATYFVNATATERVGDTL